MRKRVIAKRFVAALLIGSTLAAGCGTPPEVKQANRGVSEYFAGDYQRSAATLRPLGDKTDENFALNNLRLGSAYLAAYNFDDAEAAFLKAYEVLNSFGTNDGGRTAGAIIVDEKLKIWRGEPYERAMANVYLGLIYYVRHDYGNARGAFENALFKLRDYASDKKAKKEDYAEVESNFAVASFMLGRCWQKLGREDLARANFDLVAKQHPDLRALADYDRNAQANMLLAIEFGHGPRKIGDEDGSGLLIVPTPSSAGAIPPPRVRVDGRDVDLRGMDASPVDLLAMAQDRKWQSIDTIRTVKNVVGTGLIVGGAGYGIYRGATRDRIRGADVAIAGGLIATGLLLRASSRADLRTWEMLPRTIFILPLHVSPGEHEVSIDFPEARGLRQTWRRLSAPADPSQDSTYYIHMQRGNAGPFDWPPTGAIGVGGEETPDVGVAPTGAKP